jgi:hypothetical protein
LQNKGTWSLTVYIARPSARSLAPWRLSITVILLKPFARYGGCDATHLKIWHLSWLTYAWLALWSALIRVGGWIADKVGRLHRHDHFQ